jgi:putative inorganic carbon (hco3(-)) transporter
MIYFLIIYFLIFTAIAWRNLPSSFAILVALLPTYLIRFYIWAFPTTLLEGMIVIIIGTWFIQTGFKQIKKRRTKEIPYQKFPYQNQIILLMLASIISIFIAPDFYKALGLWRAYFLEPILLFLVFIQVIVNKKDYKKIIFALGVSALAVSIFAIYQKITGKLIPVQMWRPEEVRRVTSFYTSPNAVGLLLAPIIMIYLGWILSINKKLIADRKYILSFLWKIIVLVSSILAVSFTVSEGTWIGIITALLFFLYFYINKNIKNKYILKKIKLSTIIIILLTIILSLFYSNFINEKINKTIATTSAQNRLILWQGSWEFLTQNYKNFLTGAGVFGFPQIQNNFRNPLKMEPLIYPHNIFLNFWIDISLLGLISFIWIIISFFKKSYRLIKKTSSPLAIGLFSSMITIIVHGLIDVPYFKNDLAILFWIIIGLLIIENLLLQKNKLPNKL